MRNLKSLLVILIGSFLLLNTVHAATPKVSPKNKFGKEIANLLDDADYLMLDNKTIETTIILEVNEEHRLVLVDSGTSNKKLNAFITRKLNGKKVWTRNVMTNVPYYLTVRFQAEN